MTQLYDVCAVQLTKIMNVYRAPGVRGRHRSPPGQVGRGQGKEAENNLLIGVISFNLKGNDIHASLNTSRTTQIKVVQTGFHGGRWRCRGSFWVQGSVALPPGSFG